ncbi:Transcription factor bHLH112 like [Actinidia chinensis var. chinensis]|uniref:Transcription factor bHLH112 like n=1 Tax=Actinidia chinensis var. chinensis TaxID=1590841 RepID=A0A2R6QLP0_ACTCC|nr:Transcription factor bHLH112 like [Actinidia chinensis var. chinensis]
MGEEFQAGVLGSTWWSNSSTSFGWPNNISDGSMVFQEMQMMGNIGISSPSSSSTTTTDWNHTLFGSGRRENNYNSCMLQEDMNLRQENGMDCSQIQKEWNLKEFSIVGRQDSNSSIDEFNQTSQGFSPMVSTSYGYPSTILQTLFDPDPQPPQSIFDNRSLNYHSTTTCETNSNGFSPSFEKFAPLMRPSLPKQPPTSPLHVTNWTASNVSPSDIRASSFPSTQARFLASKPNGEVVQDSCSVGKKSSTSEPVFKRPRIETPSPLPTFKVRKEKLGDRITALQQLVSPFGKTDTASVLQEAIEYIKFLHDQVNVLSTPYMKNGPPIQHQQSSNKPKDAKGHKQDLRSRGLCLVPISSTFPVANQTTIDFWTPTFGGSFR